jgi:hypothetical protein
MPKLRKLKADIDTRDKRLIEAEFNKTRVILCYGCYKRRVESTKVNLSIYTGSRHNMPFHLLFQLASWEKSKCADCGHKNENTNLEQRELQNYSVRRNGYPAPYDPDWQKVK